MRHLRGASSSSSLPSSSSSSSTSLSSYSSSLQHCQRRMPDIESLHSGDPIRLITTFAPTLGQPCTAPECRNKTVRRLTHLHHHPQARIEAPRHPPRLACASLSTFSTPAAVLFKIDKKFGRELTESFRGLDEGEPGTQKLGQAGERQIWSLDSRRVIVIRRAHLARISVDRAKTQVSESLTYFWVITC